jgi:transposase
VPPKLHIVTLAAEQRATLEALTHAGRSPARAQTRARILLKADQGAEGPGWTDARIAEALETSMRTVTRVRRAWVREGAAAIERKRPRVRTPRKLDGAGEAYLIATACSPAPQGRARWTLLLLADRLVEMAIVEGIASNTVRSTLKKTSSNPG